MPFKKRVQMIMARVLGLGLIHFIGKTTFCKKVGQEKIDAARGPDGKPVIIVLFHGPHFPVLYWGIRGSCIVTSLSADGEILTDIVTRLGYSTVRGSGSRGARRVVIQLTRKLREGVDVALAVDGPKGPAFEAKAGAVLLAKLTGCAIVPVAACTKTYWRFQSWDRFRLPLPFNRALICVADPITVPENASDEMVEVERANLERVLLDLQKKVDDDMSSLVLRLPDRKPRDKMYHQKSANLTRSDS